MWVEILFKYQPGETGRGNQQRGMNYKYRSCCKRSRKVRTAWMWKGSEGCSLRNCIVQVMCHPGANAKCLFNACQGRPFLREGHRQGRATTLDIFRGTYLCKLKISTECQEFCLGGWEEWKLARALVGNNEDTSSNPRHLHKEPGMAVHPVMPAWRDRERCVDAFYDKDIGLRIT